MLLNQISAGTPAVEISGLLGSPRVCPGVGFIVANMSRGRVRRAGSPADRSVSRGASRRPVTRMCGALYEAAALATCFKGKDKVKA
jgi:hypothetical protein